MVFKLFLFAPVAICLFWVAVHVVVASRTDTFRLFSALFMACGMYIYSEACHALLVPDSKTDIAAVLIGQIAGPSVVPLLIMYLRRLLHSSRNHPLSGVWIVIPAVLFTAGALLSILGRSNQSDELFLLITNTIFHIVLAVELLWLLAFVVMLSMQKHLLPGNLFSFFFTRKRTSVARVQLGLGLIPMSLMAAQVGIMGNLYTLRPWIAAIVAALLSFAAFFFGLVALFSTRAMISRSDLRNVMRFNYNSHNKSEAVEEMMNDLLDEAEEEALKRIQEKIDENLHIEQFRNGDTGEESVSIANNIFNAVATSWDEDSLLSRFQSLMMNEQLFLDPHLSLGDVAEKLNTNKTYVSKLVNNTYNLGFPELINTLRIDYAEHYILKHRNARQNEIAQQCGFLSASSFNNTFKKVTGMTPKIWIASVQKHSKEEQ